jgi:hypothetical protein
MKADAVQSLTGGFHQVLIDIDGRYVVFSQTPGKQSGSVPGAGADIQDVAVVGDARVPVHRDYKPRLSRRRRRPSVWVVAWPSVVGVFSAKPRDKRPVAVGRFQPVNDGGLAVADAPPVRVLPLPPARDEHVTPHRFHDRPPS